MSNELLKATISQDGYVEVSNGLFNKRISIADYASVINSLIDENDATIVNSTIRYPSSVHSTERTPNGFILNMYYKGREATLTHENSGEYQVYLPNIMIRAELCNIEGKPGEYCLGTLLWYATDKTSSQLPCNWPADRDPSEHIWTLPLPNMFGDSRMCVGENRMPSVIYSDWTILDMFYYDVLLRSPFNNDLNVNCLRDNDLSNSEVWLKTLQEHFLKEDTTEFPYDLLV